MKKVLLITISLMLCLIINDALASNNGPKPKKPKSNSKSTVKVNHNKVKKHTLKKVTFAGNIKIEENKKRTVKNGNGAFSQVKYKQDINDGFLRNLFGLHNPKH